MPASIGVNLRVTGHCDQGGRKYMEDLFSVAYQQTEDEKDLEYAFFGIFDGHGGSEAAAFAKEHLMDSVVKQKQFWSDNDEDVLRAIRNGYMLTHLNMWKELDKWPKTVSGLPSTAGTTASVAFIRRGKIYIGHVGDSAIVLGYQEEGKDEWKAKSLTLDHKPESVMEMERIQRSGGKVVAKAGVPRVVWNRPRPGHKGPMKKTTPIDEIPFLAVARSLGDLWSYNLQNDEFIVSPDPDVGVLIIDPSRFRCLIFGTDGLWNMISPDMAVRLIQEAEKHNDAATMAEAANNGQSGKPRRWLNPSKSLVDSALERWSITRMRADNTSVVTLMLDPPGPPRADVLRSRSTRPATTATAPISASTNRNNQPSPEVIASGMMKKEHQESSIEENTNCDGNHSGSLGKMDVEKTETCGDTPSSGQMPLSGLTILTRYPEEEGVAPATEAASELPSESVLEHTSATVPLPPCASLDGRFSGAKNSMISMHCITEDSLQNALVVEEAEEDDELMNNYGNPSESYFIARLLNKSQVKNSLQNVFEEIVYGGKKADVILKSEETMIEERFNSSTCESADTVHVKPDSAPLNQHSADKVIVKQRLTSFCTSSIEKEKSPDTSRLTTETKDTTRESIVPEILADSNQESIQINEVSSSSPVDGPSKLKGRKTKIQERVPLQAPQPHSRNLRSQEAVKIVQRPQTRLNSTRSKVGYPSNPKGKLLESRVPAVPQTSKTSLNQDKIIILNRSKGVIVGPNLLQTKQPSKIEGQQAKIHPKIETKILSRSQSVERNDARLKQNAARNIDSEGSNSHNAVRVTRSKDTAVPQTVVLLKAGKDAANSFKKIPIESNDPTNFHSGKNSKVECPQSQITTRNRTNITDKIPENGSKRHINHTFHVIQKNQSASLNNHLECSKENFIAECPDNFSSGLIRGAISMARETKIGKRRNSGNGLMELEPKEKRRTRLDDKKVQNDKQTPTNQNHDITSTESLRTTSYLLGLHITAADIHTVVPISSRRKVKSLNTDEKHERYNSTEHQSIQRELSASEVDSTTVDNIDSCVYDTPNVIHGVPSDIPSRALRSRNDLNHQTPEEQQGKEIKQKIVSSRLESIKRTLRSNDQALERKANSYFKIRMSQILKLKNLQPNVEIERIDNMKNDDVLRQTRSAAGVSTSKRPNSNMSKRLSGRTPWPPALVVRNRLRKRLSK